MISLFVYLILSNLYGGTKFMPLSTSTAVNHGMANSRTVVEEPFGVSRRNESVIELTMRNKNGVGVHLISYGAAVTKLFVPDRTGKMDDVVLGFDHLEGYLGQNNPYFGAVVGRVANRIAAGRFQLDGVDYQLDRNDNGVNHLHGGVFGFDKVVWTPHVHPDGRVTMTYSSPHMDQGYPGHLFAQITYTLTDANQLVMEMTAMTDRPTPVNLIHHGYFNLAGHDTGSRQLYDHHLQFNADRYTPVDDRLIPTGEIAKVDNTPFDFRLGNRLGDVITKTPSGGYDHNIVVQSGTGNSSKTFKFGNGNENSVVELAMVAQVRHPPSGRIMRMYSDQPSFQFYTANWFPQDGSLVGKNGAVYSIHAGFCLETQNYPNAINQANFPDSVLRPGSVYRRTTVYEFDTIP